MEREVAVLMAAGLGKRMYPLTEKIPKPLVTVHGRPLIETMIEGLLRRKVNSIYVVTGYKKEMFAYLTKKYQNIVLVENKDYQVKNNISSVYAACSFLGEDHCFICESDIYVRTPDIFLSELRGSCYFGKMIRGYSADWVFETAKDRIIKIRKGGFNAYNMTGVAYLERADVNLLKDRILQIYDYPASKELFWDEVLDELLGEVYVGIHEIGAGDLEEIDTIEELEKLDGSYRKWLRPGY